MPLLWLCGRSSEWSSPAPSKLWVIRNTERCTRSFRMWDWWLETWPLTPLPPASLWPPRYTSQAPHTDGRMETVCFRICSSVNRRGKKQLWFVTDFKEHAVPGVRGHAWSGLGHIWRDPLHEGLGWVTVIFFIMLVSVLTVWLNHLKVCNIFS